MNTRNYFSALARYILLITLIIGTLGLQPIQPVFAANNWYVATAGNDSNSCITPDLPCLTINGALGKATSGNTIYIANGIYTNATDSAVIQISKNITLSGGWDTSFSSQTGFSTIDGQQTREGIKIFSSTIITIDKFIIENGYATTGGGINSYGNLTINRSIIRRNTTTSNGGGIYKNNYLEINNSSIYENKGFGIYNLGGELKINNTTISKNSGTGVYINFSGPVTINNSTITNNTSTVGGGIYNYYSNTQVYLKNSIVANNIATAYYPPLPDNLQDCNGSIISSGNNIIKTPTSSCSITGSSNDKIGIDPQLSDFLPSEGFQPLSANSPAINAGNPSTCLPTDQRGVPRDSQCDIGAYEYTGPGEAAEILLVSGDNQQAEIGKSFSLPLKVSVLDALGNPIPNAKVTFSAPAINASGTFSDSHSYVTNVSTSASGVATSPIFIANNIRGTYAITASTQGISSVIEFHFENVAWFVAPNGNDSNACTAPEFPCATINAAINKAITGDTIYIRAGTYTSVVLPTKDIVLSGGWDAGFANQSGLTTIDGQNASTGISISNISVTIDHFEITNARPGISIYRGLVSAGNTPPAVNVVIENSLIRNNTAKGSAGGAEGGGISMTGGNLVITKSTIRNNTADDGAGIYTFGGSITITNSTISGNTASGYGGGIDFNSGTSSYNTNDLVILYSTIAYNTAGSTGGGIYQFKLNTRPINIESSIIAKNSAPMGSDCSSLISTSYYNIYGVFNPSECVIDSAFADLKTDPKIESSLSGQIGYHTLLADSPAIDAGKDANCPSTDQRGVVRPQLSHCDIGAYEYDRIRYVKWNANGANSGTSWANAYTDLQSALSTAPNGYEIWVAAGTYKPTTGTDRSISFTLKNGVAVYGGFAGTETLRTQRDFTTNVTILSGDIGTAEVNTDNSYHVVVGSNTNSATILDGFTISRGNADFNAPLYNGGGIYSYLGSFSLSNLIVKDNAAIYGGGMFSEGQAIDSVARPVLTNVAFINNTAIGDGGGMGNKDYSQTTLTNVSFIGNTSNHAGGGMNNLTHCDAILTDVTFSNNTAGSSGGLANFGSNATLTNVTFSNNIANDFAGGMFNYGPSNTILTNVTFNGNSAISFGGAFVNMSNATSTLTHVTISGNSAATYGDGIYNSGSTMTIRNSILYGNGDEIYEDISSSATVTYSVVQGGYAGIGNLNADPLLNPLASNGGFTQTMALRPGSPAIDAGDDSNCPDTDQRGVTRPQGNHCDIGAYEEILSKRPFMKSHGVYLSSLTTQLGTTSGSPSSLSLLEQTGTNDNSAAYVTFQTLNGVYIGYQSFFLPQDAQIKLISTMLLQVNFKGPATSTQVWTWSIYDPTSSLWIKVGDSIGTEADQWQSLTFRIRQPWMYVLPGKEIRIQLRSNNADGDARIDYEALHITYLSIPATATPVAPTVPFVRPGIFSLPNVVPTATPRP